MSSQKFDSIDLKIIALLLQDSRMPLGTIAEKIGYSTGTIHQRIEKLKAKKVIVGSKILVNDEALGIGVSAFIGINLKNAKDYEAVLENLKLFDEITEIYYTTGNYNLFTKIKTRTIGDLHKLLVEKLQRLDGIQSTETIMCLDQPLNRDFLPTME
jgi:Lrp/AsnC family transcriptional regulator for asnA, asnC and gidA